MSRSGIIANWNPSKGFGFVRPEKGGDDVFVHISEFADHNNPPEKGQRVSYTLSKDSKGRVCGEKVKRSDDVTPKKQSNFTAILSLLFAVLFAVLVVSLALLHRIPTELAWFFLGINILTFIMYAWDKLSAVKGMQRTRESSLHFVSLLGGWPSAAFAQQLIRHKSQKAKFRRIFWLTLLINVVCFCWVFTDADEIFKRQLLPAIKSAMSYFVMAQ